MRRYALVIKSEAFLYDHPGELNGRGREEASDVLLSGWAVEILLEQEGWAHVRTHYGYEGWLYTGDIRLCPAQELTQKRMRLSARSADVLSAPQVQGILLEVLWQNSFFTVLSESPDGAWLKIRTASQVEGYIPAWSVKERLDTDAYLTEADGDLSWFSAWAKVVKADQKSQESPKSQEEKEGIKEQGIGEEKQKTEKENLEMSLREGIIKSARTYLGCAYRWGGKTPAGIDCSGLAFMSYLENGLFIYRDARIVEGYPVHEISLENLKKADLLFFPGHVALYEGDGRYIHATAYRYTPCVTENSLNPADPLYREDLAGAITAVGSIWP